jgi:tetratricopeptide (TPR) repeat protein
MRQDATGVRTGTQRATPFTPRYASPEQRELGTVSTASDIYSLGVVLRELLSAQARAAPDAPLRERELAAIVDKATAPNPVNRYTSVDVLIEDIRRYLSHEPVLAMPALPLYPARKWFTRRWPIALAGAVFAATVIGFTVKVVMESQRAQDAERQALTERDRAQAAEQRALAERDATRAAQAETVRERDGARVARSDAERERDRSKQSEQRAVEGLNRATQAEQRAVEERNRAAQAEKSASQTSEFLVSVFDSSNPNAESADIPASKLIAAAESRLNKELAGQAGTQAELYSALARVQQNMGRSSDAVANYKRAIELERSQGRPLVLAQMLARYAFIDQDTFSGKEAPALSGEALALRRKHAAPDSEELAESLALQGHVLVFDRGKLDEAGELLAQSLAIRTKRDPESAGTAQSLWYLGQWEGKMSRYGKAIDYHGKALKLREKIHGAGHPECLNVQEDLATNLRLAGRLEEAERMQRSTLAARERLHGRNSEQTLRQIVLLARLVGERGRLKESLALNQEALAIAAKTNGAESVQYAVILNNIAFGQNRLGLTAEALVSMERLMPLYRKLFAPTSPSRVVVEKNWGTTLLAAGRHEEAVAALQSAFEMNLRVHGPQHQEPADVLVQTALAAIELGRLDDADARLAQAKASPAMEKSQLLRAQYLFATGLAAAKRGNVDDALAVLENAEALLTSQSGDSQTARWRIVARRAELLAARNVGDDKAKSRELAERFLGPDGAPFDAEAPIVRRMRALR